MGDRLVLWSGGGRYVASKDVATAQKTEIPGGVLVDWGGGDTETLTGGTWTISDSDFLEEIPVGAYTGAGRVQLFSGGSPSLYFDFEGSISFLSSCVNGGFYVFKVSGGWVSRNGGAFWGCGSPQYAYNKADTRLFKRCAPPQIEGGYNFSDSSGGLGSRITVNTCGKKVTTDTGAISERDSDSNPNVSLLAGNCAIAVTFADNTTLDIPLGYCPDWVKVMPANSCPPDTCHECVHDEQKCCYSLANDNTLKLIDRFHLTS